MTKVEIYNSTESGACVTSSGACQEDIWQQVGGVWTSTSDSWPSTARNDELANADYLGVRISYTYTYLTAFFAIVSPTINLVATSIQRIEPQQYSDRTAPSAAQWASARWSPLAFRSAGEPATAANWMRRSTTLIPGGRA
ncbi:MAG: hypothetical protein ACRDID_20160 [Ktedonobacterales bacterium]